MRWKDINTSLCVKQTRPAFEPCTIICNRLLKKNEPDELKNMTYVRAIYFIKKLLTSPNS